MYLKFTDLNALFKYERIAFCQKKNKGKSKFEKFAMKVLFRGNSIYNIRWISTMEFLKRLV